MAVTSDDRSEIVFFDVETTVPNRPGQGHTILEFGAILVCPRKLVELRSYSTLVKPADLSRITSLSVRCNGITREAVVAAPAFEDVADVVYDLLHGRIWAGHNILRFDCARVKEAFAEINRSPPEPRGTLDSLAILTQKFGRRAGDMKMASLATYFGLGRQTHRSLDDVRMNLEVLKYCATVLFLESSLPEIFTENSWVSPNTTTRSRANGKGPVRPAPPIESSIQIEQSPSSPPTHPILSLMTPASPVDESNYANQDPFTGIGTLADGLESGSLSEDSMEEEKTETTPTESSTTLSNRESYGYHDFLDPDSVSESLVSVKLVDFFRGTKKIQVLYQNFPLQLQCTHLKIRFGVSGKFFNRDGRPRLNFVVDAPPSLAKILDLIDSLAQKLSVESGSSSEWHPVVTRKPGFYNTPTVRLHLPTAADGEITRLGTEIYQKDNSRVVFSTFDIVELESLFSPGDSLDAYFSLDAYDYQQNAGIRLVTKKLVVDSS
ncbi:protein NEN1 [Andrographis paniculata]|uniref:protein NEN1 n=1 Tax=Andrographis paniculata TaxID=175694 RepID=UPI0021E889BB|nr:protein NEN1 [Andrographis paniculata]